MSTPLLQNGHHVLVGVYNLLLVETRCPRCGEPVTVQAQFKAGMLNVDDYRVGDQLRWSGDGNRPPMERREDGKYEVEGYADCSARNKDFWIDIVIRGDRIVTAIADDRPGYTS